MLLVVYRTRAVAYRTRTGRVLLRLLLYSGIASLVVATSNALGYLPRLPEYWN